MNVWLIISFMVSAALMGIILFTPNLQSLFHLTALSSKQWLVVIILSLFSILQVEITKLIKRLSRVRQKIANYKQLLTNSNILTSLS